MWLPYEVGVRHFLAGSIKMKTQDQASTEFNPRLTFPLSEVAMRFSSSVRSALVGLCLSALRVAGAPGLSLSVSGTNNFAGVENFKLTTSLVNTGDEPLRLLKDPRTALSSLPTNAFAITGVDGASPVFTGAYAKFVPEYVVKNNIETAFVVLEPGQSFQVDHDLSTAYNFTRPGEGSYDIRANSLFLYIDPATNEIAELQASHEEPLKASFTGSLSYVPRHVKRVGFDTCNDDQQAQLIAAAESAVTYANDAHAYLTSHTSSTTRYVSWFGEYDDGRHSTVVDHFNAIKGYPFTGDSTYTCFCTDAGVYAYVTGDFGVINLCGAFWNAPNTGTDSRAGTLIHESSHFSQIAGTQDHVYGQSGARSLGQSDPSAAIANADSHEYFAENNPAED
ncbi:hypothetical protein PM082_003544 [Marasmius tenuissimus]|nr:hypothetical protein PM082_003544 [Marasmius tenuissimus]